MCFRFQSVKQLANALCQEKLCESSLVRIFWPRERCSLLRDDVVFVDSPGVDVSQNLDDWIDNHCLNADVFVLVLNAESTMTLAVSRSFSIAFADLNVFLFPGKIIFPRSVDKNLKAEHLRAEQPLGRECIGARVPRLGKSRCSNPLLSSPSAIQTENISFTLICNLTHVLNGKKDALEKVKFSGLVLWWR